MSLFCLIQGENMKYSAIIPVYNEQDNVEILYDELSKVMSSLGEDYEMLFIDDGSKDDTFKKLKKISLQNNNVHIIKFRRNFGQTAALDAGIKNAKGNILITLDGDLQNDPNDIPRLLSKMNEGYDVVSGWRTKRKDSFSKKVISFLANKVRVRLTGDTIHDSGCTLKVYKKICFNGVTLFGEMHRFIPTILRYKGFKITELPTNHRERKFGKSKYGVKRVFKGLFDLLFIKFWNDFSTRPIHFFGSLAVFQFVVSALIFVEQMIKAVIIKKLDLGPLLLLSVLFIITGFLTLILGFLAEIMIRMYYDKKPNYDIEEII